MLKTPKNRLAALLGFQGACGQDAAQSTATPVARSLDSSALLQGQKAVTISHNGSAYRLQSTKLGKLILTK